MSDVTIVPWSRHGKKRLYVKTSDGIDVGYIDLVAGAVVATVDGFEQELADVARSHLRPVSFAEPSTDAATTASSVLACGDLSTTMTTVESTMQSPGVDLSANVAGAAARAKRDEVNRQAPVRNLLARALGVKTAERAWRVGAKGEEKVGKQLSKLPAGWHVLHAVPVSESGTDIDHVVIGPPGVLTLNSKRHPDGKVTVYERALYVNGFKVDYLDKARGEARRASRLLTAACGFEVTARSALVFVDLADINEKGRPADVVVTTRMRLLDVLLGMPLALSPDLVATIHRQACEGRTWLTDT